MTWTISPILLRVDCPSLQRAFAHYVRVPSTASKDLLHASPSRRFHISSRLRSQRDAAEPPKKMAAPSPSSSIIVVSPTNRILLLHRLQKSSAFPSAHVFPGGNLEPSDGSVPASGAERHKDNLAYRTGGIRELFEESGVLLAREPGSSSLLEVPNAERLRGRKAIHDHKISFADWLRQQSPTATLDTDGLVPFTHWTTPPNVPKRYTTQMYVYFTPLSAEGSEEAAVAADQVETMAAEWGRAAEWTRRAREGEIILFPPQYLLLHLASQFLDAEDGDVKGRREKFLHFIKTDGNPTWEHKYISPQGLSFGRSDGRAVLALDKPGPELKGTGLSGDAERVVLVRFKKEGPRELEVRWRKDVLEEERRAQEASGGQATQRGKDMADMAREKAATEKASKL